MVAFQEVALKLEAVTFWTHPPIPDQIQKNTVSIPDPPSSTVAFNTN